MRKDNKVTLWSSVAFIFGTIALLGAVAWVAPAEPIAIGPLEIRLPRLATLFDDDGSEPAISADERMEAVEAQMTLTAADSACLALADSIRLFEEFFRDNETSLRFPNERYDYLFPAFRAMEEAKAEPVHILHYGDSQIEGDRITYLLRDSLQKRFGGSGPGLLPLFQPIPTRSVSQSLSDSVPMFYAGGIMGKRASHSRYGALAQMAELRGHRVTFTAKARKAGGYRRATLFAGNVRDSLVACVGADTAVIDSSAVAVRSYTWDLGGTNEFSMTLKGRADIYGIAVDGGRGISMTNIPMRGADGLFLSRPDAEQMTAMMRKLNTKLILLEFGGNALPMVKDTAAVSRYVFNLSRQVLRVRALCPGAPIILIGPADMSETVDGKLQTHPMLPPMTERLKAMCHEVGIAYWDMYAVMGGFNSMLAWVKHQPAWAGPDYIHFTTRGADRIANILWKALSMNYQYMKLKEELAESQRQADAEKALTPTMQEQGE